MLFVHPCAILANRRSLQNKGAIYLAAALFLLPAGAASITFAQPPAEAALLRTPFGEGTGGWAAVSGGGSKGKMTQAAENDKQALRWDYALQKGDLYALMLPVAPGALSRAKMLRFSVKCSAATPLVVVLQEKNGGRYAALFSVPADMWQAVELAPGDFVLSESKDDPKDPNNHLDLDQIENVGITDVAQFFFQNGDTAMVSLSGVTAGDRHLFLADFAAFAMPSVAGYDAVGGRVDTFTHPQTGWLYLNATSVNRAGSGLQAAYHQSDEHPMVLARSITPQFCVGKTRLSLVLASEKPAKIIVQWETRSGNKWKTTMDIAGQNTSKTWSLPFTDFAPDEQNKPVNGKTEVFDPAQIHQLMLIDVSGISDGAADDNRLTVSGLVVK